MMRRLLLALSLALVLVTPAFAQQPPTAGSLQAQIEIMNVTRQQTEASLGQALDALRRRVQELEAENVQLKAAAAKKPEPEKK